MIEAIRRISIIQKNVPNTIAAPSSALFSSALVTTTTGGNKAKIKKEKNSATINNGIHETPQTIGPKGVIHSCPAHVARKIMRKNIHKPLIGLLENNEKIRRINKATMNAAGMM